jgi:hypothetical protein
MIELPTPENKKGNNNNNMFIKIFIIYFAFFSIFLELC